VKEKSKAYKKSVGKGLACRVCWRGVSSALQMLYVFHPFFSSQVTEEAALAIKVCGNIYTKCFYIYTRCVFVYIYVCVCVSVCVYLTRSYR